MNRLMYLKYPWMALIIAITLSACGGSGRLRYETPQEAYEKGLAQYENGDFERATGFFQGAFDFGRTHQWAADSQLLLARSYRSNNEYLLAANEFTRFMQIYRSDPRVPDAEYELAMTYYDRSPKSELDQTDTERAIVQFQLFISRYQDHELTEDAQSRIIELRGKLAQKQFHTAQLYERRERWNAAAVSYEAVFDRYYDTDMADDALLGALKTYLEYARLSIPSRQAERLRLAETNYDRLIQIFPDSPLVKDAEEIYRQVQDLLGKFDSSSRS